MSKFGFSTSEIAVSLKPCIVIVLDGLLTLPDAGAISTSAEFLFHNFLAEIQPFDPILACYTTF